MSDTLRDQLLGLGFKPQPKPERKAERKPGLESAGKPTGKPARRPDDRRRPGKPAPQDARV
jgi:hypothetical protein